MSYNFQRFKMSNDEIMAVELYEAILLYLESKGKRPTNREKQTLKTHVFKYVDKCGNTPDTISYSNIQYFYNQLKQNNKFWEIDTGSATV